MDYERDYGASDAETGLFGVPGFGALRAALLFGSVATLLAVLLVPIMQNTASRGVASVEGTDPIITGGTPKERSRYRIHRSILSDTPDEPCIIYADGRSSGAC